MVSETGTAEVVERTQAGGALASLLLPSHWLSPVCAGQPEGPEVRVSRSESLGRGGWTVGLGEHTGSVGREGEGKGLEQGRL